MNFEQAAIFALLAGMMIAFARARRLELVALSGLAIGAALGLVPPEDLFTGFSSPTVITVLEILLIVEALRRSALVEAAARRLGSAFHNDRQLVIGLCAIGALASVFMNNIGALALLLPLAISLCERQGVPLEKVMMPLSFATLLGGLCSVVGTPANLLGAGFIAQARGTPLGFFELGLVGVPLTLCGLAYLWLTTPRGEDHAHFPASRSHSRNFVTEISVAPQSPLVGRPVGEIAAEYEVTIHNLVRGEAFVFGRGERPVQAGDIVVVEATREAIATLGGQAAPEDRIEAVVLPESIYVGSAIEDLMAFAQAGVAVRAVGISPRRVEGRLADLRLSVGDIVVLDGDPAVIGRECAEGGLLQLAAPPKGTSPSYFPLLVFGAGIVAAAIFGVTPAVAFGAVVLALALSGHLSLRQGLENLNWPILILLGAMIPLGNAVADTGAAQVLTEMATRLVPGAELAAIVAVMLGLAVILTPFVNNPTTVLVLAPIGIAMADQYGLPATPIVVAITIGASLDFLTPIGHHNNMMVMGVAGYRFTDYGRLGWPLVVMATAISVLIIPPLFG